MVWSFGMWCGKKDGDTGSTESRLSLIIFMLGANESRNNS